ncbi:unknown protein [Microcystis aeruginosa NIES-843]|uniref:Uncharacterized protein n=1 Tax=Microcystis aeruginosa (strain NIES-843 / IAM M-2473) TaxID=449447 RepID=B0JWQ5_MICAN|nr:unknown protein [Microcystis aeruginosa NIES-843]
MSLSFSRSVAVWGILSKAGRSNTIFLYSRHNEYRLGKHSSVDVCHGFRNLV